MFRKEAAGDVAPHGASSIGVAGGCSDAVPTVLGSRSARLRFLNLICGLGRVSLFAEPMTGLFVLARHHLRDFARIDLASGGVPDATTLLNFRHLLETNDLCQCLFAAINAISGARGGIWLGGGTLTLRNTIVSGNDTQDIQNDGATVTSTGHNLIGLSNAGGSFNQTGDHSGATNPKLSPLGHYGGRTQTHALQPGSPAINLGDPAFDPNAFTPALTTDQRGFARVQGGRVDIGAYESGSAAGIIALLWESLPPGSAPGDYSPTGDKDGDGRNNLVEYAMLTSPFSADSAALVTFTRNGGGTTGTMVLPVRFDAPDLIYTIDYTGNLANPWQEIAHYNTATSTFTPLLPHLGASYGASSLTFTDGNITGQAKGFYRLQVQLTTP